MSGLYIHVPFCHAKCAYCDFYSVPRYAEFGARYVDALEREWFMRKNDGDTFETIYIGGGTPSRLNEPELEKMSKWLPVEAVLKEFTIEVNPEDVSVDKTRIWKSIGINRVSMGVQSFSDSELAFVGRRHSATEALTAYECLRNRFDNLSIDLVIALPGQTVESLRNSILRTIELKPEHISVYILGYEQGTKLWAMRKAGKLTEVDEDTVVSMYRMVCTMLGEAGYGHYEISNFALPGKEAKHNSSYWRNVPYLGLGPSAHSFDGVERQINPGNLKHWLNEIENGRTAFVTEPETEIEKVNDRIMVGLRTRNGFDLTSVDEIYRTEIENNMRRIPADLLKRERDRIYIPEDQWLVSDNIISSLMLD